MRCALCVNENETLFDQEVSAWGEMQGMDEEPAYKESDIKDIEDKYFFMGFKMACDETIYDLELLLEDNENCAEIVDDFKSFIYGDVCMQLFSILDNQECEND